MDIHELKSRLQGHLGDGLVLIVGSGLSCAEGMPGMTQLGDHLLATIPVLTLSPEENAAWQKISIDIPVIGLEPALLKTQPPHTLEFKIMAAAAELLLPVEQAIISEAILGKRTLRLTRLFKHLLKPTEGIPVITTNYDRLIEFSAEEAGLGIDTMFLGNYCGQLDEAQTQLSFLRDVSLKGKRVRYRYRQRVRLFKPHGSFDWYVGAQGPIRFGGELSIPRLIITPGLNKFRNGYESPFDKHRERANSAIDKASRFLVIGYGFNDDHLETHLRPVIKSGKPTLLLTHSVSKQVKDLMALNQNFLSLEFGSNTAKTGTQLTRSSATEFMPDIHIWDLGRFVREVLEP